MKPKLPPGIKNMRLLIPMAKRRGIRLGSESHDVTSDSEDIERSSHDVEGKNSRDLSAESYSIAGKELDLPYDTPDKPSIDMRKRPKGIIKRIKELPGKIEKFSYQIFPLPTLEQLDKKEEERRLKEEKRKLNNRIKLIKKECRAYARHISDDLANYGEKELLPADRDQPKRRVKKPSFAMGTWDKEFTRITLSLKLDAQYLPGGMSPSSLALNPQYSLDLAPTLNHEVKWTCDLSGVRVTIYRTGKEGLPDSVNTGEIWEDISDSKPLFTIPIGYGDNSSTHWLDPTEYPHLLVCGGTGQGKSNFVNQLLCFWLFRGLTPKDLQLVLIDLKRGMEFGPYAGLPHLLKDPAFPTGIIEDLDGVMPALIRLEKIKEIRLDKIKGRGLKNHREYNLSAKPEDRMPSIVVVIDEYASIRLSTEGSGQDKARELINHMVKEEIEEILRRGIGTKYDELSENISEYTKRVLKIRQSTRHFGLQAEQMLSHFCSQSRAAGMFVILCTQHPSKEVIGKMIMGNLPSRVVFNTSMGGSLAALGTQAAFGLPKKGRAIFGNTGTDNLVQTPLIPTEEINKIISNAINGLPMGKPGRMGFGMTEIMLHSLHKLDGVMDVGVLYDTFKKNKIRLHWLQDELRRLEGTEVTLANQKYRLLPRGKHTARRLQRI